ncbi:hypothetical protein TNCV_5049461 [Trichonephila clavipes]|nr:hypothetical protein TNCV_5049461 [Trichonephila clavipes]
MNHVPFTNDSRYSLSNDSRCLLIWGEESTHLHPASNREKDQWKGFGVRMWGGYIINERIVILIFNKDSLTRERSCEESRLSHVLLLGCAIGPDSSHVIQEFLESEDIRRMDIANVLPGFQFR